MLYLLKNLPDKQIVPELNFAEQLRKWVEEFAFPRSRLRESGANKKIARLVTRYLAEFGYHVSTIGNYNNIVALPRGFKADMPLCLVGAHYDSVPFTPGADDNGSALAVMLMCAREVDMPNVGFVSFNAEEEGFAGSFEFVQWLKHRKYNTAIAHILEMVGYCSHEENSQKKPSLLPLRLPTTGDFLGIVGCSNSGASLRHALDAGKQVAPGLPIVGLGCRFQVERALTFLHRSDHVPFWCNGIPALMWTDTANYRNPYYHGVLDTPETLDYEFMDLITRVLIETVRLDARRVAG